MDRLTNPKHILIVGDVQVGKSTLIWCLLKHCTLSVAGYYTKASERDANGVRHFYIHPAGAEDGQQSPDNCIGSADGKTKQSHPKIFDRLGVQYLDASPGNVIVMDELGTMEEDAHLFRAKVLACLNGDIPVIAAVKSKAGYAFLEQIKNHPNADVYRITEQNRDALYEELLPVILWWNEQGREI